MDFCNLILDLRQCSHLIRNFFGSLISTSKSILLKMEISFYFMPFRVKYSSFWILKKSSDFWKICLIHKIHLETSYTTLFCGRIQWLILRWNQNSKLTSPLFSFQNWVAQLANTKANTPRNGDCIIKKGLQCYQRMYCTITYICTLYLLKYYFETSDSYV